VKITALILTVGIILLVILNWPRPPWRWRW